jgi:hypothetical protein
MQETTSPAGDSPIPRCLHALSQKTASSSSPWFPCLPVYSVTLVTDFMFIFSRLLLLLNQKWSEKAAREVSTVDVVNRYSSRERPPEVGRIERCYPRQARVCQHEVRPSPSLSTGRSSPTSSSNTYFGCLYRRCLRRWITSTLDFGKVDQVVRMLDAALRI